MRTAPITRALSRLPKRSLGLCMQVEIVHTAQLLERTERNPSGEAKNSGQNQIATENRL